MAFLAPIGFALSVGTAATATTAATGVLAASLVGGAVLAGTVASIAGAAGAFKGGSKMPEIPGMPTLLSPTAPAKEEEVKATETKKLRKGATKSTILTGPLGLLAPAETKRKVLLGE